MITGTIGKVKAQSLGDHMLFNNMREHMKECKEPSVRECMVCGVIDCPDNEPLHYHHDGCPACEMLEESIR